jgi:uncharacterized protein (TIGR02679 family)
VTVDLPRLERLLGGAELAELRRRLRARYERGQQGDTAVLNGIRPFERAALESLLGRRSRTGTSMKLSLTEIEQVLRRAEVAPSLRTALEALDGPLQDLAGQRAALAAAWVDIRDRETEPRLQALLTFPSGLGLLKRCAGGDPERAARLLEQAHRVLARLPAHGLTLAHLAAETFGDAHALDAGQPVSTLVLRAISGVSAPEDAEGEACTSGRLAWLRAQWARVGVSVNEMAAPVLLLNLPAAAGTPGGDIARAAALGGEPVHLSLRALLKAPPVWRVTDQEVFVCENPAVVAIAADRLGAACAPLVCTEGMPAAAQRTLLAQLTAAGARLRYHGDFDWPGLRIGGFVMRTFRAIPWRYGTTDYLAVPDAAGRALGAESCGAVEWDEQLVTAMKARRLAVDEEAVIERLLEDVAGEQLQ